mmetsp:Transcript_27390/g.76537  ORF Transcript_27390/g.76537 Transcript_27390/m.76537 type:complete len:222 (-) Transcript_27390:542-1207(-)
MPRLPRPRLHLHRAGSLVEIALMQGGERGEKGVLRGVEPTAGDIQPPDVRHNTPLPCHVLVANDSLLVVAHDDLLHVQGAGPEHSLDVYLRLLEEHSGLLIECTHYTLDNERIPILVRHTTYFVPHKNVDPHASLRLVPQNVAEQHLATVVATLIADHWEFRPNRPPGNVDELLRVHDTVVHILVRVLGGSPREDIAGVGILVEPDMTVAVKGEVRKGQFR